MSNQVNPNYDNITNALNSILVDNKPIHNVQLQGYLEALYMMLGDVKGSGPFPPLFGSLQLGSGYQETASTDTILWTLKSMLGTGSTGLLADITAEINEDGKDTNAGITQLNTILNEKPLGQDSLITLFQADWSKGIPHQLTAQLTNANSPLAQLVTNINTQYNRSLESNYQPPADLQGQLAQVFTSIGTDISKGDITDLVSDIELIKSVLTNASYANDPFVQALQGIMESGSFNTANSIQGDSTTYTGTAATPYMSIFELADLVQANPTDVKLGNNFLALFNGHLPGAGSSNPDDPNSTWATLFTSTSETGLGSFLASYGF